MTSIVSDNVVSTSNLSNFGMLSRRAGLSAIAGLSCISPCVTGSIDNNMIRKNFLYRMTEWMFANVAMYIGLCIAFFCSCMQSCKPLLWAAFVSLE